MLRLNAIVNQLDPDTVLPEDVELLRMDAKSKKYIVEHECDLAQNRFQIDLKRRMARYKGQREHGAK